MVNIGGVVEVAQIALYVQIEVVLVVGGIPRGSLTGGGGRGGTGALTRDPERERSSWCSGQDGIRGRGSGRLLPIAPAYLCVAF